MPNLHHLHTVLTRAFFDAYFTGLLEATLPAGTKREPRHLKQLVADRYGAIAPTFTETLLPILLSLRFPSYEAAIADMRARHFSDTTPVKLLLRYACGDRQTYEAVTAAYRHQIETLLTGHIQSPSDFIAEAAKPCETDASEDSELPEKSESSESSEFSELSEFSEPSELSTQLRALARTVLTAYAAGLRAGGSASLRQPTVFRLAAEAAATLLHEKPIDIWADIDTIGLDRVYARVCRTQDNYETLLAEMTQAYEDLANT